MLSALGGLFAMFLAFGYFVSESPEGKAQSSARGAIAMCRDSLKAQLPGSGEANLIRGACEKMEADYMRDFGRAP